MFGRFTWVEGQLSTRPDGPTSNHFQTIRRMKREAGLKSAGNYVSGDFWLDDNGREFDAVEVAVENGIHPTIHELSFMIRDEIESFGREARAREIVAATSEDTEGAGDQVGFLGEPHATLYPPVFKGEERIPEDVKGIIKAHVLNAIELDFHDPDNFIYFTIFGSGVSYNWDEGGDFDVQMWVDLDRFQELHGDHAKMTQDELIAAIRRIVQTVNFPSFADLGIVSPNEDAKATMLIQYYAKPGKGTPEENLSSKPYACYDLETDEWLVKPDPIHPTFYGEHFLALQPKAEQIALQAEAMIGELERNTLRWQFWFSMHRRYRNHKYQQEYEDARDKAEQDKEGIKVLFKGVFEGRQQAYAPEGEGIQDERDMIQKLLEVWGTFQKLKHYAREPLPWDEQGLPAPPDSADSSHDVGDSEGDSEDDVSHNDSPVVLTLSGVSGWQTDSDPSHLLVFGNGYFKTSDWAEVQEKAQRYYAEGRANLQVNSPEHTVAEVQGDTGTYITEIWRNDPNNPNVISLWSCECPWGEKSWGRTRQWKKFEGRPCAHVTMVNWEAQRAGWDEELGYGEVPEGDQQMSMPDVLRATLPSTPVPGGPNYPANPAPATPAPVGPAMQAPPPVVYEQFSLPGAFSSWEKTSEFVNGDYVRMNKPLPGLDDDGNPHLVPRNTIAEVIWSDPEETIVIVSLNSGQLGPHNVRITGPTTSFSKVDRTRGQAPRRRR